MQNSWVAPKYKGIGKEWSPRICAYNQFAKEADGASPRATLWETLAFAEHKEPGWEMFVEDDDNFDGGHFEFELSVMYLISDILLKKKIGLDFRKEPRAESLCGNVSMYLILQAYSYSDTA